MKNYIEINTRHPRKAHVDLKKHFEVESLRDASNVWINARDTNGYVGSCDMRVGCGDVYVQNKHVATVSYNGRVWVAGKHGKTEIPNEECDKIFEGATKKKEVA